MSLEEKLVLFPSRIHRLFLGSFWRNSWVFNTPCFGIPIGKKQHKSTGESQSRNLIWESVALLGQVRLGSSDWLKSAGKDSNPIAWYTKKAPKWIHWQGCCIKTLKTSQIVSIHCHCHLWALPPRQSKDVLRHTPSWVATLPSTILHTDPTSPLHHGMVLGWSIDSTVSKWNKPGKE